MYEMDKLFRKGIDSKRDMLFPIICFREKDRERKIEREIERNKQERAIDKELFVSEKKIKREIERNKEERTIEKERVNNPSFTPLITYYHVEKVYESN